MQRERNWRKIFIFAAALGLAALGFAAQRAVPFMMDDEWYGTNLATGGPLAGFSDVVESQVWHFLNWGGRCITHGVLQLTLMCGELWADILNLLMTLLLTLTVCAVAGKKDMSAFLLVHAMIYAMCANLKMSMLWQAGTVNYVYSSVWILIFLLPYLRSLRDPDAAPLPLAALWLIPVGVMAGWSNENMGPACFLLAAGTAVWLKRRQKKPTAAWMLSGVAASLAGSVLVVAAPGNFVRSAVVERQTLYERFYSMLTAGTDFLLPAILPAAVLLLVKAVCLKRKIDRVQWALLATAVLSYGAMVLSPHYPDRATFGTMILLIALTLSLLGDMEDADPGFARWRGGLTVCYVLCAAGKLAAEIFYW